MLDEFVAMTGCHRKHTVRLLRQGEDSSPRAVPKGRRVYDEAVREALTVVWEASDRICGKRLKTALPSMVDSLKRHGHLSLDPDVQQAIVRCQRRDHRQTAQAPSDSRLAVAESASRRGRLEVGSRFAPSPIGTNPNRATWRWTLVAHCGESAAGSFISSLVVTDVRSAWTEAIPLLAREQSLVVEGLEAISRLLPVPIRGIDSDNDSVFINETVLSYCCRAGHRVHTLACAPQERPGVDRAKEWFRHTALRRSQPLLGTDSRSDDGAPLRGYASVRQPLPALIQAAEQESGRWHRQEAVREACYSL